MADDFRYMIFRIYTDKEREDYRDRSVFYGWTKSKNVKKAFLSQRTSSKYQCVKMYEEDINDIYSENIVDEDTRIDFIKLKSAKTGDEFLIFSTSKEMKQYEENLQQYFVDLCSLEDCKDTMLQVNMITHLDQYYADALEYIGYRPQEIESLFPSAAYDSGEYEIDRIANIIDMAYDGSFSGPMEEYSSDHTVIGQSKMDDVAKQVIYSLESFVKILKDDL